MYHIENQTSLNQAIGKGSYLTILLLCSDYTKIKHECHYFKCIVKLNGQLIKALSLMCIKDKKYGSSKDQMCT